MIATVRGGDGMASGAVGAACGIDAGPGTAFGGIGNSSVCNSDTFSDFVVVSCAVSGGSEWCTDSSDAHSGGGWYEASVATRGTGTDVDTADVLEGSKKWAGRGVHAA